MKKLSLYALLLLSSLGWTFQSCSKSVSYADLVKDEDRAIARYISTNGIDVISEADFIKQGYTTTEKQYVKLDDGVYMNIMHRGEATDSLANGTYNLLFRYVEISLQTHDRAKIKEGDTISLNMHKSTSTWIATPDPAKVTITSSGYSGSFETTARMYKVHNSTTVPEGWLLPLEYLRPTRTTEADKLARVKLIVAHDKGSQTAQSSVFACLYELAYNLGK